MVVGTREYRTRVRPPPIPARGRTNCLVMYDKRTISHLAGKAVINVLSASSMSAGTYVVFKHKQGLGNLSPHNALHDRQVACITTDLARRQPGAGWKIARQIG